MTAPATPATVAIPADPAAAHAKLVAVEQALAAALVGRDDVVRALLVALVAREHIVLLGPPGTAKSYAVELLARSVASPAGGGLNLFEWLMTKFSGPDEIFGPVSVTSYKQDRYERIVSGKLPEAEIAFLDEVFKAGEGILNSLLTILNERKYDNGPARLDVPLQCLIGASNELPQADESGALWDRFLLRIFVDYVDDSGFDRLLRLTAAPALAAISAAELAALQARAATLPVPDGIYTALVKLRKDLAAKGITASDRRWRKTLGLVRAHAVIEGRDMVEEDDLAILRDCLWQTPDQRKAIAQETAKVANPKVARIVELGDAAAAAHKDGMATDDTAAILRALTTVRKSAEEANALAAELSAGGRALPKRVANTQRAIKRHAAELAAKMGF